MSKKKEVPEWTLEEQIQIQNELSEITKSLDRLIDKAYLMGYAKGLSQKTNHD